MAEAGTSADGGNGTGGAGAAGDQGTGNTDAGSGKWYEPLGFDVETVGWMENRGLTGMDQTEALKNSISGFRNAEKFLGVPKDQLLRLPDFDKAEQADLDQFYTKIGRPAEAKDYSIAVPDGVPTEYADFMKGVFHKAGISDRQAKMLSEANNQFVGKVGEKTVEQLKADNAVQRQNLEKDWGEAYDTQFSLAKHACAELKVSEATVDALEKVMGYDGVYKFFADLGGRFGEPNFHSGGGGNDNGPMTPVRAQARIKELQSDKEWSTKYLNGNKECLAEMTRLQTIAFPTVS